MSSAIATDHIDKTDHTFNEPQVGPSSIPVALNQIHIVENKEPGVLSGNYTDLTKDVSDAHKKTHSSNDDDPFDHLIDDNFFNNIFTTPNTPNPSIAKAHKSPSQSNEDEAAKESTTSSPHSSDEKKPKSSLSSPEIAPVHTFNDNSNLPKPSASSSAPIKPVTPTSTEQPPKAPPSSPQLSQHNSGQDVKDRATDNKSTPPQSPHHSSEGHKEPAAPKAKTPVHSPHATKDKEVDVQQKAEPVHNKKTTPPPSPHHSDEVHKEPAAPKVKTPVPSPHTSKDKDNSSVQKDEPLKTINNTPPQSTHHSAETHSVPPKEKTPTPSTHTSQEDPKKEKTPTPSTHTSQEDSKETNDTASPTEVPKVKTPVESPHNTKEEKEVEKDIPVEEIKEVSPSDTSTPATISRAANILRTALKVLFVASLVIEAFAALCLTEIFPAALLGSPIGCCIVLSVFGLVILGSGFTLKMWTPKPVQNGVKI